VSRKTGRSRPRAEVSGRGGRAAAAVVRRTQPESPAPRSFASRAISALRWPVWGIAILVFFAATAMAMERQITWYLAVDQFGYLNFAHDLLSGHVFHDWPPLHALQQSMPPRTDVLAQTYVDDGGRLYCRYSPGFPMLLAAWMAIFGDLGAHYLNPTLYLVLLAIALVFQLRLFRSPWRAGIGTVLITLFPTYTHLWGLTLTRDMSAHVFAFTGLFLLLQVHGRPMAPVRMLGAMLALGFAASIRPDAVLYLLPATLMLVVRLVRERNRREGPAPLSVPRLGLVGGAGILGLALGVSPLLAYNWVATGNPLIPTQGMELPLLPSLPPPVPKAPVATTPPPAAPAPEAGEKVGFPSPGWHGGTYEQVQGGGLRVSHLATTLPGIWKMLGAAYSPFLLGVIIWGALVAAILRPVLAAGAVSYAVVAILFFGCWPRPDFRYLIGVFVFLPMLLVEGTIGTLDLVRLLWKWHRPDVARGLGIAGLLACVLAGLTFTPVLASGALQSQTFYTIVIITGLGLAASVALNHRVSDVIAAALMLALVFVRVSQVQAESGRRAPFQRPQMLDARANMQKLLEPNSVVITTEDVGRPAENIEFYSGVAHAMYLTDLERWRFDLSAAATRLIFDHKRPYLFIPASQRDKQELLATLRHHLTVELVAAIPPQQAMAHFVAAPFHRGVAMELYRISWPAVEERLRQREGDGAQP
jgi:hypothetical protein